MNIVLKTTPIYLSDEEAQLFVQFQKYHNLIGLLNSIGAFDIKYGSVTIHFNGAGEIRNVEKKETYTM